MIRASLEFWHHRPLEWANVAPEHVPKLQPGRVLWPASWSMWRFCAEQAAHHVRRESFEGSSVWELRPPLQNFTWLPATVPGVPYCQIEDSPLTSSNCHPPPTLPYFLLFSIFHVSADFGFVFFFVFFPLNVPSGSCLKKKNKDICKILWFIFAMIGSTASFHMTDSSWEDLARPGVLQIPKYPKCGLHLQETCLRTLNTCSQKTCSSSNLAGSFLRLYILKKKMLKE